MSGFREYPHHPDGLLDALFLSSDGFGEVNNRRTCAMTVINPRQAGKLGRRRWRMLLWSVRCHARLTGLG